MTSTARDIGWWSCGRCGHYWEAAFARRCPRCKQAQEGGTPSISAVESKAAAERRQRRVLEREASCRGCGCSLAAGEDRYCADCLHDGNYLQHFPPLR